MYRCSVWDGLSETLNNKLQKVQKPAARIITKSRYDACAGPLLTMRGWDKVSISRAKQKAVVMYKTLNKEIPPYMQDMLTVRDVYYKIRLSEDLKFTQTKD